MLWVESAKTDLFFITLNKAGRGLLADDPLSGLSGLSNALPLGVPIEDTAAASPTGQRYITPRSARSQSRSLRPRRRRDERDESNPYLCLGPARYVQSHKADRPMQIIWELERPMPAEIYDYSKAAAG